MRRILLILIIGVVGFFLCVNPALATDYAGNIWIHSNLDDHTMHIIANNDPSDGAGNFKNAHLSGLIFEKSESLLSPPDKDGLWRRYSISVSSIKNPYVLLRSGDDYRVVQPGSLSPQGGVSLYVDDITSWYKKGTPAPTSVNLLLNGLSLEPGKEGFGIVSSNISGYNPDGNYQIKNNQYRFKDIEEADWPAAFTNGGLNNTVIPNSSDKTYVLQMRYETYFGEGDPLASDPLPIPIMGDGQPAEGQLKFSNVAGKGINFFAMPVEPEKDDADNKTWYAFAADGNPLEDAADVPIADNTITSAYDLIRIVNFAHGSNIVSSFSGWNPTTQTDVGVMFAPADYDADPDTKSQLEALSLQSGVGYQLYLNAAAVIELKIKNVNE